MSQIYNDAAGNKYLGDCKWGNNDISYPSANYLQAVATPTANIGFTDWRNDVQSLLISAGFTSLSFPSNSSYPSSNGGISTCFQATVPTGGLFVREGGFFNTIYLTANDVIGGNLDLTTNLPCPAVDAGIDYCVCAGQNSLSMIKWRIAADRSTFSIPTSFYHIGKLLDVNPNYSYYTPVNNSSVIIAHTANASTGVTTSVSSVGWARQWNRHYIAGAEKDLLQTGRAAYSIACSDGQTPTSQWATDMWVYDNNATLGYPVIGRVPNMLLGTGTYTYLKPVKIQGSVFPDNGSPWYIPVGQFAGKVLLMRCYSSLP